MTGVTNLRAPDDGEAAGARSTNEEQAVCQVAPDWWGAYGPEFARPDLAVHGCQVCPLNGDPCLDLMASGGWVSTEDVEGLVASGLAGRELAKAINVRAGVGRRVQPCGTDGAYRRHVKAGEEPCGLCRSAHAEAVRAWRAA